MNWSATSNRGTVAPTMDYTGTVTGGSREAALLGFPTANILLSDSDVSGTYTATVWLGDTTYPAVAYADQSRKILEAHLFDFSGDLYGKDIRVVLHTKLRDAERFDVHEELVRAITHDVRAARAYFNI